MYIETKRRALIKAVSWRVLATLVTILIDYIFFRKIDLAILTEVIESKVTTLPEIIQEILLTKYSERQGRLIDFDQVGSMERKNVEGYF